MNDEMVITVIAAGYDDPAAAAQAAQNDVIAINNPLVDGFVAVDPRKPVVAAAQSVSAAPMTAIPRLNDDDDDLSEIFKILDKK